MNSPEISVIVANYNHAKYIEKSINSLLNQSFSDFEIIIIDDGSKDNSKDVIEELIKLDSRIQKPIYFQENKGKWFALNYAIGSQSKGRLITTLDADDMCHPNRLERQLKVLTEQNSYFNVTGFKHCYTDQDLELGKQFQVNQNGPFDILGHKETLKRAYLGFKTQGINHFYAGNDYEIHANSVLFLKQLWTYGIRYNPNELGLMIKAPGDDTDFLLRATLLLQKTSVLKEPLYLYRRNSSTNPSFTRAL